MENGKQIITGALDGLMPDVTFYLDVELEIGLQRVDAAGSMSEVQAQLRESLCPYLVGVR